MSIFEECYSVPARQDGITELRGELQDFSHDGLTILREDLSRHAVLHGSWFGCVLSYKRGAPGSVRRDRIGRARNAFTVCWDNGWLTNKEVLKFVEAELEERRRSLPREPLIPELALA
ncbi:MAG: hypothetical protein A3J48_04220 [Candidatus Doudnabacteria bacterium RIFCSPHIGHO2_02_FULL_46_11]|uniref:Uncharacterized protein n=1 Tax=Candidatus Doudnabacteria bacterium RIFCSPHIGHO2_02_FULL_46_11 TaxID=1817832 RepID=A0A1F5P497_9BACT|nr:MAG: hypothetical protein A3J48_04220 [Candidatus Doudnabacteria bacterium RIFCSPHIGHO2_02_FULL_46_11]